MNRTSAVGFPGRPFITASTKPQVHGFPVPHGTRCTSSSREVCGRWCSCTGCVQSSTMRGLSKLALAARAPRPTTTLWAQSSTSLDATRGQQVALSELMRSSLSVVDLSAEVQLGSSGSNSPPRRQLRFLSDFCQHFHLLSGAFIQLPEHWVQPPVHLHCRWHRLVQHAPLCQVTRRLECSDQPQPLPAQQRRPAGRRVRALGVAKCGAPQHVCQHLAP